MSAVAVGALAGALASSAVRRMSIDANADNYHSINSLQKKNVGILAVEVYTPSTYVSQEALEEHSGVSKGRYTIGLGQDALGITGDSEDVNSLALTVVQSLLEKYEIDPNEIGRLEIGTETLVDKSKSTKTVLMQLFEPFGNTDIEGATVVNACYGGTAALLNAMQWVESDGWDGRYAIVVAADIAAYARGPARPTCGVGAVAVLVGRDAPLSFMDPRERATHASHVWDFFKPDHTVEYPTVDGAHSQTCYYRALEDCYTRFADKLDKLSGLQTQRQQTFQLANNNGSSSPTKRKIPPQSPTGQSTGTISQSSANPAVDEPFSALSPDYFVFHAPYNKLVQKSYARLFLLDARRQHERLAVKNDETARESEKKDATSTESPLAPWLTKPIEETYTDRALDGVLKKLSSTSYKQRLSDSSHLSKLVGNTYAASVFMGLASLIDKVGGRGELTPGKTAVVFSYGSGAMATMYRLHVRDTTQSRFTIDKMISSLSLETRLLRREEVHPRELDYALETRARMHRAGAPYSPVYPTVGRMFPGTYYLNGIDSKWRRTYSRIPLNDKMIHRNDSPNLAPPIVLRLAKQEEVSIPVTGKLSVLAETNNNTDSLGKESVVMKRVACVVSGIAAGLPGKDGPVFREDNLERLIRGDQCIGPISGTTKMSLLEKNVVQLKKNPNGTTERFSVSSQSDHIQIAAQLGSLDLCASYGVAAGLVQTMDYAAQVAVAAGLEALKSAKLVSGKSADSSEWKLEDKYRDTTGVVYASSFPAMDAAVGEVMRFLQSKTVGAAPMERLVEGLRNRLLRASPDRQLSDDDETALARLLARAQETEGEYQNPKPYEFDRKFLFKVLVLGNSQLAQMCGCRGPNTQTNAACAGTTQAIAMAQDMLISGRAERVVVVAGDNASGDTLLPWLGSGFRALGAASTKSVVEDAALPFDLRRSGMILGAGGIGMVIETEMSLIERLGKSAIKARLLATQYSNSAFHGAALDRKHIASELKRFFNDIDLIHGISKAEIATHGVYFSHETCTHASSASSCSGNEIAALREALGDQLLSKLLILNTKGFTGHPMGVSFEDVAAVQVLLKQTVPPVPNYKVKDDYLGELNISKGGPYACRYALRFAAGFGSQVAFALYSTGQDN